MKASRFLLVSIVCISLLVGMTAVCHAGNIFVYNVRDYGAVGDGVTNDTTAFQNALTAAGNAGGGIVWASRGTYKISTHLTVPSYVTLEGESKAPVGFYNANYGSVLLASEGSGNANGTPFITLGLFANLKGMIVYYPNQNASSVAAYPWTIRGSADNAGVIDCTLVNPYQGIDLGTNACGRHYVRGVYGQPLYRGIWLDQSLDIGRVENVHFWPFWSNTPVTWSQANGIAFYIGRNDWEFFYNTYCYGYSQGYRFYKGLPGTVSTNGNFNGIAANACGYPLYFTGASLYGIHITNGQFASSSGNCDLIVDSTTESNGVITFDNCTFYGAPTYLAYLYTANVTFNACTFRDWSSANWGIVSAGGKLTVSGCDFTTAGPCVFIYAATTGAVVTGNQGIGAGELSNACTNAVLANNIP